MKCSYPGGAAPPNPRCTKCGGPTVCLTQTGKFVCAAECQEGLPHVAKRIALEEWNAALARKIKNDMPEGRGFVLVSFDFGEGGSMAYASTGQREDTVHMLRELLSKLERLPTR
jgi:hypothetical protein